MSDVKPPPPEPFTTRYARWVKSVVGSGFKDFGDSHIGSVRSVLVHRLPVTGWIGLLSWRLDWGRGLAPAIFFATNWRDGAAFHQERIYPLAHAVPSLVVVILFCLALIEFHPYPGRMLRTGVGIANLVVLMLPGTTALWLNGVERISKQEYNAIRSRVFQSVLERILILPDAPHRRVDRPPRV